jgi:uncharacterized protein
MNKRKIINDPVYGFITIPYEIVFDLIEHPYFQRLRRIAQLGLTYYVYPGALHTRFHHALGAVHLMTETIETLRSKGIDITDEEAEAATIAILLHDIGHGPFSHALEHTLLPVHHEDLSLRLMQTLNAVFEGKLQMGIDIFCDKHPKKFLHQLVSGQLDMDRMDYLNRDSYFTGVHEGVIGYDRLIKMLNVVDNELVVEEKGVFSIEKFLIARRLMYWQVYLHKTVVSAEQMLIHALKRAKSLTIKGIELEASKPLRALLNVGTDFALANTLDFDNVLHSFTELDDVDIFAALKAWSNNSDTVLRILCSGLVNRRLFKVELSNEKFGESHIEALRKRLQDRYNLSQNELNYLLITATETNTTYNTDKDEIKILYKNGQVVPMSQTLDYELNTKLIAKYFLCYPKF